MGLMSADWSKLSEDVQKCLISCLRREMVQNMTSQEVSNSLIGLRQMNVLWFADLSNDDRIVIGNALLRVKDVMNSQAVANIIYR